MPRGVLSRHKGAVTDDRDQLKQIIQTLAVGIAVADPESWSIAFENAKFFQWFPPQGEEDEPLDQRLPGFNAARAADRLQNGRPFSFECETVGGARKVPLSIELKPLPEHKQSTAYPVDSATYNILWVVGACCVVRPSSDWNAAIGAWRRLKRNTNSLT